MVLRAMSSVSPSPIDRRIVVTRGPDDIRKKAQRVSDLRALPFVVLLGEPGIGKSTVLEQEAGVEGTSVLKVRELINGMRSTADTTLFLDALDEYRIDGQPSDKVHGLAGAMASVGASRWRLSCRSEDWRKDADIKPIQHTTAGAPIVVAQLLPLDQTEALAVLSSFGERDPNDFLARAEAFGAGGFTESPLSLRLLHTAVAAGTWPKTRFDLFASAVESLLYERNEEHKWTERHSREAIVSAASEASLLLLASGAGAIWSSNDEPPADRDARAYLTFEDISMERPLLRDMLDTALFRGEGEVFEPMHRTIAEYLAGRCLAQAVSGSGDRAALPLSRALPLITGNDGEPPTELRGLYAWFAAHLAKLGHEAEAMRLIETDAVTVLAYGDAAVFGTPARRAILENLDRADPYFRASNVGITAVGGLSGEDLAADFTDVLNDPSDNTHRLATVLEVLTHGEAVHSLRSVLFDIATDPDRPEWQRLRAADAWTNGATDPERDRRRLFDALADEPVSTAREAVRAHLAAALPSGALTLADVKSVIADFERSLDDNTIMRLFRFTRKLEAEPRPKLFDEPTTAWRPAQNERRRTREVDDVLDHALAAAIGGTPNLDGARLWRWIVNVRGDDWTISDGESGKAFAAWLNQDPERETVLFDAILADDDPANGPWVVGNTYIITSGRRPSTALVRSLLSRADAAGTETGSKRLLAIAVEIARHLETDIDLYWETHEHVAAHPGCYELLERLSRNALEARRVARRRSATEQERRHATAKAKNLRILVPLTNELRVGEHLHHLGRAAEIYFHPVSNGEMQPTGFDRMTDFTDDATARAIAEGWEHLARTGLPNVDAASLGVAEAENRTDDGERAVVAGLDRLLAEGRCPDLATMPVAAAIVILKSGWSTLNDERQRMLREWAVNRLDLDPAVGVAQILDFWGASLDAGATELGTVWPFMEEEARDGAFQRALEGILASRLAMPPMPYARRFVQPRNIWIRSAFAP